jgi:hypothetical protein
MDLLTAAHTGSASEVLQRHPPVAVDVFEQVEAARLVQKTRRP